MIDKMEKLLLVCREKDQKRLLRVLRESGVVHLLPFADAKGADIPGLNSLHGTIKKSIEIAKKVADPIAGPVILPDDAARRLTRLAQQIETTEGQITRLREQLKRQKPFGDVCAADIKLLRENGIPLTFWSISSSTLAHLQEESLPLIRVSTKNDYAVVAASDVPSDFSSRTGATAILLPEERAGVLDAELQKLICDLEKMETEKRQLAFHLSALRHRERSLTDMIQWHTASDGALTPEALFIIRGWIPALYKEYLSNQLAATTVPFGVQFLKPEHNENPPTLWRPPKVARPVNALFRILGTTPGYRECDVTPGFLIALPIFCAMLIADGGYGLLLGLAALAGLRMTHGRNVKELAQLVLIIGLASIVWGILIASFFGFDFGEMSGQPDGAGGIFDVLDKVRLFDGPLSDSAVVNHLMTLSFVMGAVHMSIARLWRGWRCLPSLALLSHLGWAAVLWGILFLTNTLVLDAPIHPWMAPILIIGMACIILFSEPEQPFLKRLGLGVASLPFGMLGALSDTVSYVRLMAVGLASTILGATFNQLASEMADVSIVLAVIVFVLGHTLNIALAMVALFAHGVRLNMLEFSNHLGMSWTGYLYRPFQFAKEED